MQEYSGGSSENDENDDRSPLESNAIVATCIGEVTERNIVRSPSVGTARVWIRETYIFVSHEGAHTHPYFVPSSYHWQSKMKSKYVRWHMVITKETEIRRDKFHALLKILTGLGNDRAKSIDVHRVWIKEMTYSVFSAYTLKFSTVMFSELCTELENTHKNSIK